jgi:flagellar hook-basal body complex protein FliE
MVDNAPLNRPFASSKLQSIDGLAAATGAQKDPAADRGGPAFQALLEKLQAQARSLQHDSETVAKPEELNDAVVRARSSLSEALSLSDRLLEAYREAAQRGAALPPTAAEEAR